MTMLRARSRRGESMPRPRQTGWRLGVKRALDVSVAVLGLGLSGPVLVLTAVAIRVTMGGPVLFVQDRPGRYARPFRLLKFRTMTEVRASDGSLLPDGDRLTRLGRILRALSIDELPQFWNILCGDLSAVGPRPLLVRYIDRYTAAQARRHDVLPGLTGWAQVHGRNAISWEDRLELDAWYVEHWSLWLDVKIIGMTVSRVVRRRGISSDGHATMPEFTGSNAAIGKGRCDRDGLP
jgi:sugar transferase EpsL